MATKKRAKPKKAAATKKATKKNATKKKASAESSALARVLLAAADLPVGDTVRTAAEWRLSTLLDRANDDTRTLARLLGVHVRSAQRLRVAYGVGRPLWARASD